MHLLTAPTAEPVTLDEAKLAARLGDSAAFDGLVPGLIAAARQLAEQATGRQLMAQTWRTELADWPATTDIIAVHQATAAAVSYWTGSTWATLAGSAYEFGAVDNGTALAPVIGTAWPSLADKAIGPRVRIDLTAGTTDAADVPDCVRLYIRAAVAYGIDNPGEPTPPRSLASLLDSARVY